MPDIATNTVLPDWSIERCAVAAECLRQSGHLRLGVRGESMLPSLWPGDIVEIASCSLTEVRLGDILLALRENRFFLHRLVSSDTDSFLLCGDSMPGSDPSFHPEALLGRVVRRVAGGYCLSEGALRPGLVAKMCRALGLLMCHCTVARRFALMFHARRVSAREFAKRHLRSAANPVEFGA